MEEPPLYDELIEEHRKDAWFTDGSATYTATGQRKWRAVAYAPLPGITLWQTGLQASSQWAELIAASLAILEGNAHYLHSDSWGVYKSLTVWLRAGPNKIGMYKDTLYGGQIYGSKSGNMCKGNL